MKKYWFIIFGIFLLIVSCDKNEKNEPVQQGQLSTIFTNIDGWYTFLLFDTIENRIYYIPRLAHSDIISYDYEQKKIIAQVDKNLTESLNDGEAALGYYNGRRELYIGHKKTIYIYDADNLSKFDSITTPDTVGFLRFTSMANLHDSLIFITGCGSSAWPPTPDRSRVYNRSTKSIIPAVQSGDNCALIKAFEIVNPGQEKEYGVISIANNYTKFALERYDKSGELIEVKYSEYTWKNWDKPIGVSNGSPYFILSSDGQLFSKQDLSLIGVLGGEYLDYYISPSGDKIYAFSRWGAVDIFNYPSLQKERTIPAPVGFGGIITPYHLFQDGNKLIEIYYNDTSVFLHSDDL